MLLAFAATEGEGGEPGDGDEEQGADSGKRGHDHQSHQGHQQRPQERGLLKAPGQHQMRARNPNQDQDGHHHSYNHQQYIPQYSPQPLAPRPIMDHSPIQYQNDTLTRHPSINMDWQTLRVPRT